MRYVLRGKGGDYLMRTYDMPPPQSAIGGYVPKTRWTTNLEEATVYEEKPEKIALEFPTGSCDWIEVTRAVAV